MGWNRWIPLFYDEIGEFCNFRWNWCKTDQHRNRMAHTFWISWDSRSDSFIWKVMFVLALHQTLLTQRHFIKGYKVTSLHTSKSGMSSNPAAILVSDLVGSVTYMLGLFIELPWQCPPSLSFPKFIFLHKMKTANISNFNVRCAGFRLPKVLQIIYEHLIAMSVMHQRKHLCFNT